MCRSPWSIAMEPKPAATSRVCVDATPDVAITEQMPDVASAEHEVFARRVDGILVIPQYFERDLLHGRPSPVALYADASYFLIYQRVAGAVAAVAHTVGAEIEAARLVAIGVDPAIAEVAPDPMPLTAVPLFNPEGGYATYVLPAAFVLILQQVLLMGVGLLNTLPGSDPGAGSPAGRDAVRAVILAGKLLAYLALAGRDPSDLSYRAALSLWPAAARRRRTDPHFRRAIRAGGRGPWLRGGRHLSQSRQGAADLGRRRSSLVHGRGLLLAREAIPPAIGLHLVTLCRAHPRSPAS